jgi:hypothetical protein
MCGRKKLRKCVKGRLGHGSLVAVIEEENRLHLGCLFSAFLLYDYTTSTLRADRLFIPRPLYESNRFRFSLAVLYKTSPIAFVAVPDMIVWNLNSI